MLIEQAKTKDEFLEALEEEKEEIRYEEVVRLSERAVIPKVRRHFQTLRREVFGEGDFDTSMDGQLNR